MVGPPMTGPRSRPAASTSLQSAGVDARMIELPGAFHAFDVPTLPGSLYLPKVQNGARCRVVERRPVTSSTPRPAARRCRVTRVSVLAPPLATMRRRSASPRQR